jgi:hypothetical protein
MIHKFIPLAALSMIATAASFPPPTFSVSTDVHLSQASISDPWGTTARPLARIQDDRHHYIDFVANELIVITANESDILPLLPKGGANRLLTKALTPKGDPNYPATLYLISVDSSAVSTASLVTDLRKIDPLSHGNHLASSLGALKTLALAAHEQASGVKTSLNFVFRPTDFGNWTASDGVPTVADDNGVTYTSDSFQWPYNCQLRHATDSTKCVQDIGVAAAWRALFFAGRFPIWSTSIFTIRDSRPTRISLPAIRSCRPAARMNPARILRPPVVSLPRNGRHDGRIRGAEQWIRQHRTRRTSRQAHYGERAESRSVRDYPEHLERSDPAAEHAHSQPELYREPPHDALSGCV